MFDDAKILTAALSMVRDGVVRTDDKGVITHATDVAASLHGQTGDELVGSSLSRWYVPAIQGPGSIEELVKQATSVGQVQCDVLRIIADGECLPTSLRLSCVEDSTGQKSVLVIVTDLSLQRRLRDDVESVHRMATLGDAAAGLMHEIANPLAAMMDNAGYIHESLDDGTPRESLEEAAGDILMAARRMGGILDAVRRFAHSGTAEPENMSFEDAVEDAAALLDPRLATEIELVRPREAGPTIRAMRGHLTQVVLNLFKNAAQAMTENVDDTRLIVVEHGEDGTRGYLRITDTGPGIPEAVCQRLFVENVTTKKVGEGTGLGLAMCARLIREAGGDITVNSDLGEGATFTVYLPLAVEAPEVSDKKDGGLTVRTQRPEGLEDDELEPSLEDALPPPRESVSTRQYLLEEPELPSGVKRPTAIPEETTDVTETPVPKPRDSLADVLNSFAQEMSSLESV